MKSLPSMKFLTGTEKNKKKKLCIGRLLGPFRPHSKNKVEWGGVG
jgi:hypothetical protein